MKDRKVYYKVVRGKYSSGVLVIILNDRIEEEKRGDKIFQIEVHKIKSYINSDLVEELEVTNKNTDIFDEVKEAEKKLTDAVTYGKRTVYQRGVDSLEIDYYTNIKVRYKFKSLNSFSEFDGNESDMIEDIYDKEYKKNPPCDWVSNPPKEPNFLGKIEYEGDEIKSYIDGEHVLTTKRENSTVGREVTKIWKIMGEKAVKKQRFEEYKNRFKSMLVKEFDWSVEKANDYNNDNLKNYFEQGYSVEDAYVKIFDDKQQKN